MKNWPFWFGCLTVAAIATFILWPQQPEQLEPATVAPPPAATEPAPATPRYPVSAIAPPQAPERDALQLDQPLPPLPESDARMRELLAALFAEQQLGDIFLLDHFIERFVVMVDNLPRTDLPPTHRPLRPIPGEFRVAGAGAGLSIAPENARRYAPLIDLLARVDREAVIAIYLRLYPLFQTAYARLGYPDRYFNDRLVELLDHLLQTPVRREPLPLVRPKYYYQFADPELEALSAGQKIILRSGEDNARRLRTLIRDFRNRLASVEPTAGTASQ